MHTGFVPKGLLGLAVFLALMSCAFVATQAVAENGSSAPATEPYSLSFSAGGYDASGHFLGGTELTSLVAFGGKLYAGIGYWMDRPEYFGRSEPKSAAQVLVLDSKHARWRQEYLFNKRNDEGGFQYHRLSTLDVLQFHRFDDTGQIVGALANILAVGLDSPNGAVYTQTSPGKWEDTRIPTSNPVRSLVVHYDPNDKTEKVYSGPGGSLDRNLDRAIYSGVYDPSAPGQIRWNPTPENIDIQSRVMSMLDCDGVLFAAAKPSIFRRDDATRRWKTVYSYPISEEYDQSKYASGFRGLTCEDDPGADGRKVILGGFEGVSGDIVRIDPRSGAAVVEVRSRQFLTQQWGASPEKPDIIAGYNDAPVLKQSPEIRVFSLLAGSPNPNDKNSAWFLSRTAGSPPQYDLHKVNPPARWPNWRSDSALWSVRAIAISPFPEDRGQVMYLGGYDGHSEPNHNTAWMYRVGIDTALGRYR